MLFLDISSLGNANDQCLDNLTIQYETAPCFSDNKYENHMKYDMTENDKLFIRNGYKDSKGSSVFDKSILEKDLSCLRTVIVVSVNQKPSDGDEKTDFCK